MAGARFEIAGRVQGVGYRVFVWRAAQQLHLCGWVKNRPDRTVEVAALGAAAALDALAHQLRQGPPGARVDGVERTPWAGAETGPAPTRFEIVDE